MKLSEVAENIRIGQETQTMLSELATKKQVDAATQSTNLLFKSLNEQYARVKLQVDEDFRELEIRNNKVRESIDNLGKSFVDSIWNTRIWLTLLTLAVIYLMFK